MNPDGLSFLVLSIVILIVFTVMAAWLYDVKTRLDHLEAMVHNMSEDMRKLFKR